MVPLRQGWWLPLLAISGAAGCLVDPVPMADRACPCAFGWRCDADLRLCVPTGEAADAGGSDAGPPDGGRPDAGVPDAGPIDAGEPDAGVPDAGPIDAGEPDAGVPDAGPIDAGEPDAGDPDAGSLDAGDSDAGLQDVGPIVYLALDEGSGTVAADSSGNQNDATIFGAVWTTDSKSGGQALIFDGVGSYLELPDSVSMDFDKSDGTIEMWIKPTTPARGVYQALVVDRDFQIELSIQPDGDLFYYPWVDPAFQDFNLTTNPLVAGQWNHVAVTWSYATKSVKLYVGGVELPITNEYVPTMWLSIAATSAWQIGGSTVKSQYLDGVMDEVRIYSRALSAEEILARQ